MIGGALERVLRRDRMVVAAALRGDIRDSLHKFKKVFASAT